MKTDLNKRKSYSFFIFPSVLHACEYRLDSAALQSALVLLETTPGIRAWRFVREEASFTYEGKPRVAELCLATAGRAGRRHLVQLLRGRNEQLEDAALEAGRAYALAKGYAHWPLRGRQMLNNRTELLNRECAHSWLLHASNWDTRELEGRAVTALSGGSMLLSELASYLGLTATQARVVFLRAWLRDAVEWDISKQPVTQDFEVCHA